MTNTDRSLPAKAGGWRVVAGQECRDIWLGGRGPLLVFGFSVLLSVVTYVTATNLALNFLEQREAVNLTLQVAVSVGVLVVLLVSADGISGERERATLETLLLTPVSRRAILWGKFAAALTLWFAAFAASIPYLFVLGRGVSLVGPALVLGLAVGTLIAAGLAAAGLVISAVSNSNKASLAVSLVLLLALWTPTQLPRTPQGWIGDLIVRANPVGAGMRYLTAVFVNGHDWTRDLSYLVSPLLVAVAGGAALSIAGPRIVRLTAGVNGQ